VAVGVTPAPTIETGRLRLRAFEEGDIRDVVFYADPEVMRYIPGGAREFDGSCGSYLKGFVAGFLDYAPNDELLK